jgi:hypothetical protein
MNNVVTDYNNDNDNISNDNEIIKRKDYKHIQELKKPFKGKIIYKTKSGVTKKKIVKLNSLQLTTHEICCTIDDLIMTQLN